MTALRAPFPWFGGKSRVAPVVWRAFGNVPNYVEPFAGSLATLLARPHAPKIETVNDLDCYLANFWRALAADPDAVARHADWPVNEADLSARHQWLVDQTAFRERMAVDPDFYDAKIAGWWVWGLCSWIGSGWCALPKPSGEDGDAGRGVHRKLPHLGDGKALAGYLGALSERLRRVRVACGPWERVVTDSVTWRHGVTGIFLDPPYDDGAIDYAAGGRIAQDVAAWAREHSADERLRIAVCGYEGDYDLDRLVRARVEGSRRLLGAALRRPERQPASRADLVLAALPRARTAARPCVRGGRHVTTLVNIRCPSLSLTISREACGAQGAGT